MSLLDDVQFVNKYDREEACVKVKNRLLINAKIKLYKCFKVNYHIYSLAFTKHLSPVMAKLGKIFLDWLKYLLGIFPLFIWLYLLWLLLLFSCSVVSDSL